MENVPIIARGTRIKMRKIRITLVLRLKVNPYLLNLELIAVNFITCSCRYQGMRPHLLCIKRKVEFIIIRVFKSITLI